MKSKSKAILMSLGAMALVAMLGGQAHAVTADTFLSSHTLGDSGQAEQDLLEGLCGCSVTFQADINDSGVTHDGDLNYVSVAPATPGFFLVKYGVGDTDAPTHYVFANTVETTILAWTNAQLTDGGYIHPSGKDNFDSISHYAYSGGGTSVPEPASLLLLGAGLAGLGIWRRKQA